MRISTRRFLRSVAAAGAVTLAAQGLAADLPPEYVRLSYLQSTGQEYIKTGLKPKGATPKVSITYQYVGGNNETRYVFGYFDATEGVKNGTAIGFETVDPTKDSGRRYRVWSNGVWIKENEDSDRHTVVLNDANGTTVDGVIIDAASHIRDVEDKNPNAMEYYVFGRSRTGDGGTTITLNSPAAFRIWDLTIWINGVKEREYVPARQKSTGELGLYDLVHDTFATNASGQGGFTSDDRDEYQSVKFIQSDEGAYINTGIIPNGRVPQIDITYRRLRYDDIPTGWVFGVWDSNKSRGTYIGFMTNVNSGKIEHRLSVSSTEEDAACFAGEVGEGFHTLTLNSPDGTSLDGVRVEGGPQGLADDSTESYFVFGRRVIDNVGSRNWNYCGRVQISALKIRMNGQLVRDFIPCFRKSDYVVGLYDCVVGQFYPSLGKTGFRAGVDKSEVKFLKYAESDGRQYVDTGVSVGNAAPVIRLDYQLTKVDENSDCYIFGCWDSDERKGTAVGLYKNDESGKLEHRYRVWDKAYFHAPADTKRHLIEMNTPTGTYFGHALINSELKDVSDGMKSGYTYYAFARLKADALGLNPENRAFGRIYSLKIDVDGVPVCNFVPAVLKGNGNVGLYDCLNEIFCPGQGDAPLTAGPVVNAGLAVILK